MPARLPTLVDLDREIDGPPLRVCDAVRILGFSADTVRELLDAQEIRTVRFGRNRKILWVSFREYLFRAKALPLTIAERHLASRPRPN